MSSIKKSYKTPVGELRPSQILHTFGVGAMIDLPYLSAMVLGLDEWPHTEAPEIREPRLLEAVRTQLGPQVQRLLAPPRELETGVFNPFGGGPPVGVPVGAFPRWMQCPWCHLLAPLESGLFTLKTDPYRPDRTRYEHTNCTKVGKKPDVLPARFLVACERGHLDEFPWLLFVHKGQVRCSGPLELQETGGLGDAFDVRVKCRACGSHRQLGEAFGDDAKKQLPLCRGRHPHLRRFDETPCPERVKPILQGATNSWFGISLRALAVPEAEDKLGTLVDEVWSVLQGLTSKSFISMFRPVGEMRKLEDYDDDAIWDAMERKRAGTAGSVDSGDSTDLLGPEWRALTEPGRFPASDDFLVRAVAAPAAYASLFTKIVLVERLREVQTLVGFTRISSPGDFADAEEVPENQRAPLARKAPVWTPAAEIRGEGIFLEFSEEALHAWENTVDMDDHDDAFREAHRRWRRARELTPADAHYPGLRYMLLHSFAHALMRQLALECGYSMASIRERIYAAEPGAKGGPMAGVLIYTAAADSEGTLGGLVALGQPGPLGRHIAGALAQQELCASDPHCAEHDLRAEGSGLHGASCHACLFAPESSCERGNRYLDRALLVPTVERTTIAFFGEPAT